MRKSEWVVYAKPPFGGPEAVLAYLSRYTHRVAISNSRLISADAETVSCRWKDYRIKTGDRQKVMRLATDEFIRRFLLHVLPDGFHRVRHYGPLAGASRKANVAKIRSLLGAEAPSQADAPSTESIPFTLREPCPDCGGPMRIVEIFRRGQQPRARAPPCPCGCGNMVRIGEDRTERLDQIPARYQVIVTIRPKYACPKGRTGVVQARAPAHLLEGSWPTEALLAQIAVSKHSEHMPLNRQAAVMARHGVPIDRSVLANWMVGRALWSRRW